MKPKREIRFSVRSDSHRAATWKCWSERAADDVYLTCRETGYALKVSLHASGDWRLQYDPGFYRASMPVEHRTGSGRIIYQWPRPAPIAPGHTLALRIVTPWSSVTAPHLTGPSIATIPVPGEGRAVECIVFLLDPGTVVSEAWPGLNRMHTQLVGSYKLPSGGSVCVVWWEIDMPALSPVQGLPKFFEGHGMEDLKNAEVLRMLGFTDAHDGSRVIYDALVKPART